MRSQQRRSHAILLECRIQQRLMHICIPLASGLDSMSCIFAWVQILLIVLRDGNRKVLVSSLSSKKKGGISRSASYIACIRLRMQLASQKRLTSDCKRFGSIPFPYQTILSSWRRDAKVGGKGSLAKVA